MATELLRCHKSGTRFHYHGLDMISDLCSGDFAMGLDLIRKIFDTAGMNWRTAHRIGELDQHTAIERYAAHELDYVRYLAPNGRRKYHIIDRLCWLAKESVLCKTTMKEGKVIPLIKIHLDIAESALTELEKLGGEPWDILDDLIKKGVLFPLDTSRSRQMRGGTRRYQIRRILLPRYGAPLGRHTAIRIDDVSRLVSLVEEPDEFVRTELSKTPDGPQMHLVYGESANDPS